MVVWCGLYALELVAPTLRGKILAAKGQYLGIAWFEGR